MFLGILIGLSVIVVSFLGWALWSAKPVVGNEIDAPKEAPPSVTYDEIQDCEMPYYGSIYH